MSRLYFDCPIQAAYMAKEFGVKLHLDLPKKGGKSIGSIEHKIEIPNLGTNKFKKVVSLKTDGSDEGDVGWVDTGEQEYLSYTSGNDRIYVAKESEYIFQPKKGDKNERGLFFDGIHWTDGLIEAQAKDYTKIAFRNNKPFFTTLVEST